jgi:transposase
MASLQKRTVKGIDYWSLVESRRVNGKPRPVVIEYFGNTKKFAERLMNSRNENKILKSYSHGDTHALIKIAERLEIERILDDGFTSQTRIGVKRSASLLLIALQSICNPGSKSEFESWVSTTTIPYDLNLPITLLTSRRLWDQMDGITEIELAQAEDAIVQKIFKLYDFGLEKIALDYTNYFSYISSSNNKSELAKRRHNKQKRNDLRQYSLALITTKESGLPLYSHIYEGNTNDQTVFPKYLTILKERIPNYNPKTITLVFDGGSNTKDNLKSLETHYICSFSLSSCKNLYDIEVSDYKDVSVNGKQVRSYRITQNIWDKERECILTYSHSLYAGQLKELDENIVKASDSIKQLNEQLSNPKSRISKAKEAIQSRVMTILCKKYMNSIFNTQLVENDEGIVVCVKYIVDEEAKKSITYKYFGKKLLITDQKDWSTDNILKVYREQDCIEKIFRSTKDNGHCAIRPQFHYTDQKIRVHIFCCLLGLTLATILHREVVAKGFDGSKFHMLDILNSIRRCWIKDKDSSKVVNVLEELDDNQAKLWNIIQSL